MIDSWWEQGGRFIVGAGGEIHSGSRGGFIVGGRGA